MANILAHMLLRAAGRLPVVTRRPAHRFEREEAGPPADPPGEAAGPGMPLGQAPLGAPPAAAATAATPGFPGHRQPAGVDPPFRPAAARPAPAPQAPAQRGQASLADAGRRSQAAPQAPQAPDAVPQPRQSWATDAREAGHGVAAPQRKPSAQPTAAVDLSRQADHPPDAAAPVPADRSPAGPAPHPMLPTARPAPATPADLPPPEPAAGRRVQPQPAAQRAPSDAPWVRPPPRAVPGAALPRPAPGRAAGPGTAAAAPAAPAVQVHIGSVEIRALPSTRPPQPLPPAGAPVAAPAVVPLGLADYLAGRGRR